MKRITGRLVDKGGKWYAVINLYTTDGKRKEKWQGLNLEAKRGTKTEANHRLVEILAQYNTEEQYLQQNLSRADQEKLRVANLPFEEYIAEFLEMHRCNISQITYSNYEELLRCRIAPFFKPQRIPLKELNGDDINAFYAELHKSGLSGTTAQRYHALIHIALKHAVKRKILATNPCDQADRPKSNPYIATYYNADEVKQLIDSIDKEPMRIVIILAAYYGLRRSEVVGLKWSAIDFTDGKIYIKHKIIEDKNDKTKLTGMDVMKTKSSYRSLPLIPFVRETLLAEQERQAEMRQAFRGAYNERYSEYVCVDAIGNLFTPSYVSSHFPVVLKQNGLKVIRFHDLRHSCASLLLAQKVPMKMIQEWLGHSDMNTTANIYSHTDYASKIESATVISTVLG